MPVSWKQEVLGTAVRGCVALRCPGFLLKSCLSFSLPALRMGSGCGDTPPACLPSAPGGKPTSLGSREGDTSAEFVPGQSVLFDRKALWPLGPEGSQLVGDLIRGLQKRTPSSSLGTGPHTGLRCSHAKACLQASRNKGHLSWALQSINYGQKSY